MSKVEVYFSGCPEYSPEKLRPALEKVLAPVFDSVGGVAGKRIMVKPNWLAWRRADDPASVHPVLLLETLKMLQDHGAAEVVIKETPGVQDAASIAGAMGIAEELGRLGISFGGFLRFESMETPPEARFRRIEMAADFQDYDVVLNLAKAKTHGMMTLTFCVKNLFGMVRGAERLAWHLAVGDDYDRFADLMLDIYSLVKPQINLLDGVICMEGNGPGSGDPVAGNFLAASTDALALDLAVSEKVFQVPGTPIMERAALRGLPEVVLCGEVPEKISLKLPEGEESKAHLGVGIPGFLQAPLRRWLVSYPALQNDRCIGCGLCVKVCPPRSLKLGKGQAEFHLKSCIRCYCCQEHCPVGAIIPRKPWLLRVSHRLEREIRRVAGWLTAATGCFRKRASGK